MSDREKSYNPSTFRLLWQENRLLLILVPMFIIALVGMALARYYFAGSDEIVVMAISFCGLIFLLPFGFFYLPFQGLKSMHLNLNVDTYEGQPDIYYTKGRALETKLLYKVNENLSYYETCFRLDKEIDLTVILRHDGLPLYSNASRCRRIYVRHFRQIDDRLGVHGEMALYDGVPYWHKHSETINCRALDPSPYQVGDGAIDYFPTFELIFSQTKDIDLFVKYQKQIWEIIVDGEAKEKGREVPLVTV